MHAWAILFVYEIDKARTGVGDRAFLENAFDKLSRNFSWWLNRKDADGRNIFQGGFLGLDNIGVFDRSAPLPTGGTLDQADGTAWMSLYCQNMVQIAIELARHDRRYLEHAQTMLEHYAWIAAATNHVGADGASMWDDEDGFFYDVLRRPDGSSIRLKVRSLVGLMPLVAATVLDPEVRSEFPELAEGAEQFLSRHPAVAAAMPGQRHQTRGDGPALFAMFDEARLRRILARMLDEEEFLGPHGIRSVSRWHAENPFVMHVDGRRYSVDYLPAESDTGMFGGNSNWRGPVWFPINFMLIRALLNLHAYFGDDFTVECPTGSGNHLALNGVAQVLSDRLVGTFLRGPDGRRPVYGGQSIPQQDPHWRDLILFYEYFHGDNGAGIGASHQTGWTGGVAILTLLFRGTAIEWPRVDRGSARHAERVATSLSDGQSRPAMTWPQHPVIYEVNTAVWLDDLSRGAGRRLTLADLSAAHWAAVTPPGIDAVWLMGVWERSPEGLPIANDNPTLQADFRAALPDLQTADVIGSPYCVRRYVVDAAFGGPRALAAARTALADRGVRLVLDYVPNHVAPDHPWVNQSPELFIQGADDDVTADPAALADGCGPGSRPRPRPVLPALARCRATQCLLPRPESGDGQHSCRHRGAMRRDPLRHGHADDQPRVRRNLGRQSWSGAGWRVLAGRDRHAASEPRPTRC